MSEPNYRIMRRRPNRIVEQYGQIVTPLRTARCQASKAFNCMEEGTTVRIEQEDPKTGKFKLLENWTKQGKAV